MTRRSALLVVAGLVPLFGCASGTPAGGRGLREITGPAGRLLVTDQGAGGVPIVFIHSSGGNMGQWREELSRLGRDRRVIAYDVRGHGGSAKPTDPAAYRVPALAGDVEALVEALSLEKIVLVGHSMGASIALAYAARHPDRVAGLVLVDGASHREGDLPPGAVAFLDALAGPRYPELVEQYWGQILKGGDPEVAERVLGDMRATPKETVVGVLQGILAFDHLAAARAYDGPTFLILSQMGDTEAALDRHAELTETVRIEGTGHWLHLDRPRRFAEVLDGFLAQIERSRAE